jgi:hypothetical protein
MRTHVRKLGLPSAEREISAAIVASAIIPPCRTCAAIKRCRDEQQRAAGDAFAGDSGAALGISDWMLEEIRLAPGGVCAECGR